MKREVTRMSRITMLTSIMIVIAFTGVATAESASSKGAHGSLVLKTQTVVQGTTLPAGNYDVREVHTAQGDSIEFLRKYWNELASEMVQAEEDQVLGRVPVVERPLDAPAARTQLELTAPQAGATALQIRGVPANYVFAPTQTPNQTIASTNCGTNGAQN